MTLHSIQSEEATPWTPQRIVLFFQKRWNSYYWEWDPERKILSANEGTRYRFCLRWSQLRAEKYYWEQLLGRTYNIWTPVEMEQLAHPSPLTIGLNTGRCSSPEHCQIEPEVAHLNTFTHMYEYWYQHRRDY